MTRASATRPQILIVDDQPANLLALRRLLNHHDADVFEAMSGNAALALALDHDFALALIDVNMPVMNGYEVAELMRSASLTRNIPVIFLTAAYADEDHRRRGYLAGAVDYIEKPIEPVILNTKVHIFLELYNYRRRFQQETVTLATDIKRSEETIKESEQYMRSVINLLPEATMVIDIEGRVQYWNRAMEKMTGVRSSEIVGKDNFEYALPFYGQRRPILINLRLRPDEFESNNYPDLEIHGDTMIAEESIPRIHGNPVFLRGAASVVRDSKGQVVGAIETIFDLTDRRRLEEALRDAKETADRASDAKSRFLAAMSHELRTPLNSILAFSEVIQSQMLGPITNPHYPEYAGYVYRSGQHLLNLINDILDISKIEAGKMELEFRLLPISCIFRDVTRLIQESAQKHSLSLTSHPIADSLSLWADERAIKQILFNLSSNAIKFTPAGGQIALAAEARNEGVEIRVSDTGIGIPKDQLDRVTRPFEQIDNRYTRTQGGTGLGLSLVQGLVNLHGGTLSIHSEVGTGTTVTVWLPKAPPSVDTGETMPSFRSRPS
jgi:PAS domain S-box-containing protein